MNNTTNEHTIDVAPELGAADTTVITEPFYALATTGKRFGNYLIDMASFYLFMIAIGLAIGIFSGLYAPELLNDIDNAPENPVVDRFLSLLAYAIYMGLMEGLLRGKTMGKLLTKTRTVYTDGSPISFGTGFKRGLIKAIPFCAFSALGTPCRPWQDIWTNTMVIDEKESILGEMQE
jgi:uncharacterized RDD family membrane protein YckC